MASGKEIKGKISSIKNTKKITSAMELVAASKMKKAQVRMSATKPYSKKIVSVVGHLANSQSDYRHAFMEERDVKSVGIIIVSTDRGLCGGLNVNLFKQAIALAKQHQDNGEQVHFCLFGNRAVSFFKAFGGNVLASKGNLGDAPTVSDLIGSVKVMLDAYSDGSIDKLYLLSNEFINTMTQNPEVKQVLPLPKVEDATKDRSWDYIYEPSSEAVVGDLLVRYIESMVYQAVVENIACEQAARMIAMKSATDNAGNLIDELNLIYNKARQASITQEISEIVSGAAAL